MVYVAYDESNYVSVIDTGTYTLRATIPVGVRPSGIAFNPSGTEAFVTNLGGTVSVINTGTDSVIHTVNVIREDFGNIYNTSTK